MQSKDVLGNRSVRAICCFGQNIACCENILRILRYRFRQVGRLRKYAEIGTAKVLYRGLAKIHILRQNAFDKAGKEVRIAADIIADNGCYYRRVVAA